MSVTSSSFGGDKSWRRYEHWGSITASAIPRGDSTSVSSLSRSSRLFQQEVDLEKAVPGPGTYESEDLAETTSVYSRPRTSHFGNKTSTRLLMSSGNMWSRESKDIKPEPATYNVLPPSTEEHVKNTLSVTCWKLQILKDKYATKDSLPIDKRKALDREMKENYLPLLHKVKELKQKLVDIESEKLTHSRKYPLPSKPGFSSTSKRIFQVPDKLQEAPTFYRSMKDWDFGTESRVRTIDMAAFKYTDSFKEGLEREKFSDIDMVTGLARPKSRCRKTDFHGPNTESKNVAAPVGKYAPELLPLPRTSLTASSSVRGSQRLGRSVGLEGALRGEIRRGRTTFKNTDGSSSVVSDLSFA